MLLMRETDVPAQQPMSGDLSGLPTTAAVLSVTMTSASVLNTPAAAELHEFPPPPPRPQAVPIESWKPRLERRVSELAGLIGAPGWFRCRFDSSRNSPPGADNKISVWTNGYLVEYMQGHPCDSHSELHPTEEDLLYSLFKHLAEMMNLQPGQPTVDQLLGRISQEWRERYLADRSRRGGRKL